MKLNLAPSIARWLARQAARLVDDTASPARQRQFLESERARLASHGIFWQAEPRDEQYRELQRVRQLLDGMGERAAGAASDGASWSTVRVAEAEAWMARVSDAGVASRHGAVAGCGRWLDRLAERLAQRPDWEPFVAAGFEQLLRHVELRRQRCLMPRSAWRVPLSTWQERHDAAIAFCRWSRGTEDLRFLNAALKLNDWSFARRRRFTTPVLIRYLVALAEQEYTLERLSA